MQRLALIHQLAGEQAEAWGCCSSSAQLDLDQMGRETDETGALRARLWLIARGTGQRRPVGGRLYGAGAGPTLGVAGPAAHDQSADPPGQGHGCRSCGRHLEILDAFYEVASAAITCG